MKNMIMTFGALGILLIGCALPQSHGSDAAGSTPDNAAEMSLVADSSTLSNALETYYLSEEDPVYGYLQNKSIQRFFNMWFQEYIGEDMEANWNYDTLAPVQLLDHSFASIAQQDEALYTCTFSTDDGRCGYIIVSYGEGEDGPYISKWSLQETTPYLYDLRANASLITAALNETDIDLSTATAARVEWIDTKKNRGDRIILFRDDKGDNYVCYFGDGDFTVEKQ